MPLAQETGRSCDLFVLSMMALVRGAHLPCPHPANKSDFNALNSPSISKVSTFNLGIPCSQKPYLHRVHLGFGLIDTSIEREREREPGVEYKFVAPVDETFMETGGLRGESPAGPSGATDSEGEMGKWVLPPAPRGKLTPR